MLNSLPEKIDPRWTAVLVVDMQNDFVSPGGVWAESGADISMGWQALACIVRLIARARRHAVPVYFVRSTYNSADNRHLSDVWLQQAGRSPSRRFVNIPVCVEGSWGWELAAGLEPRAGDSVITKHRYSAFHRTDLDASLKANGIRTLLVTGVGTSVCVESTVRHAFEHDYYSVIVGDGCGAYTREVHEQALTRMNMMYGEVATSDAIFASWDALAATAPVTRA
ncbi:MAG: cysteine hydrolase [Betaproteobacteria bacterium]|nr:cysteine hydrolase [Betaproteobacteria bacterium]